MKAALLESPKNMSVREVQTPEARKGTVVLRVGACGICGSDLKFFNYGDRVKEFPAILGHEIAGEVIEVGKDVSGFAVGDKLSLGNEIPCKKCYACLKGLENICENVLSVGTTVPGGLSEHMLLAEEMVERGPVNRMPDGMTFDEGALAEPLGCVVNGLEFAGMEEGKSVLVVGTGPIGCMAINMAQLLGASKIVATDKNENRLKMAEQFGADNYIYAGKGIFLQETLEISGSGYDVVFSACSDVGAHEQAIKATAKGGFVNLFGGVAKGLPDAVSFPSNFMHYREISVGGSFSQTKEHHRKALEYLASGRIAAGKLITHKFRLDDVLKAFDAVQNQEGLKVMVNP